VALNIATSRVSVTSITAGSVVVTYTVAPSIAFGGTQLTEAAAKATLEKPITFNAIKASTVIPSTITAQYTNAVTATGVSAVSTPASQPNPKSSGALIPAMAASTLLATVALM